KQIERAAQRCAVAPGAIGDGEAIAAVKNAGRDMRGKGLEQLLLALVRRPCIARQLGSGEIARATRIKSEEIVAVDPLEVEQLRQGLAETDVGKGWAAGVEHQKFRRLWHSGLDGIADHLASLGGGKLIAVVPAQRLVLDPEVIEPAFEGLELPV